MAVPKAAAPPVLTAPAGLARCDQLPVRDSRNTPPTTTAIPASLSTVRIDCSLPP